MILFFVLVPPALVIAGAVVWANFIKPPPGRHAFADPADRTDPDGDAYVTALREPGDDFWERRARLPLRVEVLTRPGTGQMPMLPADPDPTIVQPADVAYLGVTSGEFVDDLFAKHAATDGTAES